MGKMFKLLSVGDTVYSALNGKPMKVTNNSKKLNQSVIQMKNRL